MKPTPSPLDALDFGQSWTVLDVTRPAAHLRELAPGGPLTLAGLATRLGLRGDSSAHTAELRERGGHLPTLRTILDRAAACGLDIEIRVRPR